MGLAGKLAWQRCYLQDARRAGGSGKKMADQAPEIESASIVLVGSFNPAILHPEWLAHQSLIRPEEAEQAKVEVVSRRLTVIRLSWFELQVLEDRFSATATDPAHFQTLQECVLGIFSLLEFTPINAMGLNRQMHFRMRKPESWASLENALAPKKPWAGILSGRRDGAPTLQTLSLNGNRDGSSAQSLIVKVEPSFQVQSGVYMTTNEHFEFSDASSTSEPMNMLSQHWLQALAYSKHLANKLIGGI